MACTSLQWTGKVVLVLTGLLGVAVAGVARAGDAAAQCEAPKAGARPNILWISCEDMCPNLGCYGDGYARTPHLDKLATQGVRFTRAFSVAPVCSPSRSAIITGMYPTAIGTQHHRSEAVPPAFVKCFPEYLRAAGYFCTNNKKTDYNFACPATAWDENHPNAHWRNGPKGRPFFAVFNLEQTHEGQMFAAEATVHDPAQAKLPPYYPDTPEVRRNWARYYDQITKMDAQVGKLLKELEDERVAENTIVFFWSDHGMGLPRGKRWLYDSGTQVALLARWPGKLAAGSVREDLVSLLDLGPTVLTLAGVPAPAYFQGQPFLTAEGAAPAEAREYVYHSRDRMDETTDVIRSVRDRQYRYIRNLMPERPYAQVVEYQEKSPILKEWRRLNAEGKLAGPQRLFFAEKKPAEELYDCAADPHNVVDLAGEAQHQATLARLRAALDTWMKETGDPGAVPEADLQAKMRPDGKVAVTAKAEMAPKGGKSKGPVTVTLSCATEGASIGYYVTRFASDKAAREVIGTEMRGARIVWQLYTGPITITESCRLRAKACRLGYKDGPEVQGVFEVKEE